MKIREEQLDAFRQQDIEEFEVRAVRHLREHFAEETRPFTDDDLRRRVRSCMPRAAAYGFTSEKQIVCFVDATFLLGERFDAEPIHQDIVRFMRSKEIEGNERAGGLLGMASGRSQRQKIEDDLT